MTLSESMDLVDGLLTKVQKNINSKPDYFRPIYHVYYMVIYVAIQDAFAYSKLVSKSRNRTAYRYRNKRQGQQRKEAREWLSSIDCRKMWEDISDIDWYVFQNVLERAYDSFNNECDDKGCNNIHNRKSVEVSRRLKGLSI